MDKKNLKLEAQKRYAGKRREKYSEDSAITLKQIAAVLPNNKSAYWQEFLNRLLEAIIAKFSNITVDNTTPHKYDISNLIASLEQHIKIYWLIYYTPSSA